MKRKALKGLAIVFFLSAFEFAYGQDAVTPPANKYMFFPHPLANKTWRYSLGVTMTAMPQDITEEVQVRAPAGDFHVLRGLPKNFYLDGRVNFQFVQNHASLGVRWAHPINNHWSFSIGDDFAFWYGKLLIASFDTRADGWLNYPSFSVGFRSDKDLLFTLKGEAFFNLAYHSTVGGIKVSDNVNRFNGWGATIMMEQPFYAKKNISLGVRLMYTNFFWQTWSLYETFDRNIFYPEVIVGFIF